MAYDAFGRTASALTPQGEVSYAYDALDRTASRTLGEETTAYAYAGITHDLAKEQGQEAILYATSPSGPLARKVGDSPAEWLLRDLHTDLSATVSLGGAVTASFTYSPWGEPRSSSRDSTLGFQADPTDPETGLVDMGTRLYDPTLGRFTTRDVLFGETTSPLSLNQFAYTQGSPIGFHDPTGMVRTSGGGDCGCSRTERERLRSGDYSHGRASRQAILLPGYVPAPPISPPTTPVFTDLILLRRDPEIAASYESVVSGTRGIARQFVSPVIDFLITARADKLGRVGIAALGRMLSGLASFGVGCARGVESGVSSCVDRGVAEGGSGSAGCVVGGVLSAGFGCIVGGAGANAYISSQIDATHAALQVEIPAGCEGTAARRLYKASSGLGSGVLFPRDARDAWMNGSIPFLNPSSFCQG